MTEESVPASVYSFIFLNIHSSLFTQYAEDEDDRLSMTDNYLYHEFLQTLLKSVQKDGGNSKYSKFCEMAYPEYKGNDPCAYNVARAFSDTKRFMEE